MSGTCLMNCSVLNLTTCQFLAPAATNPVSSIVPFLLREAFNKKNLFFCQTGSKPQKPSAFFGQKWPFQEVKIFYFDHAVIFQSPHSVCHKKWFSFKGFPKYLQCSINSRLLPLERRSFKINCQALQFSY